jgi:hypothetical protein
MTDIVPKVTVNRTPKHPHRLRRVPLIPHFENWDMEKPDDRELRREVRNTLLRIAREKSTSVWFGVIAASVRKLGSAR